MRRKFLRNLAIWKNRGLKAKSLYRSRAGRHFYETGNVIWAGFGLIGNTEKKKFGPIMSNF